jgi:asparagine synthase (glutamine-hydrolysing)
VQSSCPGHWLELGEIGEPATHAYWKPPLGEARFEIPEEELEGELERLMIEAFRYRMISDVPLGVFLSGGIDSTLSAALLKTHGGGELRTFTIGFDDPRFDESGRARDVARHLGTRHTERIVTGADFRNVLSHWADLFDEPFGDSSGVPTYLVSRLAREHVKVALSADGGDELFMATTITASASSAIAGFSGCRRRPAASSPRRSARSRMGACAGSRRACRCRGRSATRCAATSASASTS